MKPIPRVKPDNPHILFDTHYETEYHRVVARLACRYTPQGGRVIDLGSGLGQVLGRIREQRPDLCLHAADIDEQCLELTRGRIDDLRTTLIPPDGVTPDNVGSGFDTAIMCHSLEHMSTPLQALRDALRLLAPGGHLILAVPNPVRPDVMLGNLFRRNYVNPGHVCAWDRAHWINFLERIAGLDVVEYPVDEVRALPQRLSRRVPPVQALHRALGRVLPWWTFSNIAVVRHDAAGADASRVASASAR